MSQEEAEKSHWTGYRQAVTRANSAYWDAVGPAKQVYDHTSREAVKVCLKVIEAALEDYRWAIEAVVKDYWEATKAASKAYDEVLESARKVYHDANEGGEG